MFWKLLLPSDREFDHKETQVNGKVDSAPAKREEGKKSHSSSSSNRCLQQQLSLEQSWRMNMYLFIYYLIQFCGHSWIFTNMIIRFLSFGKDSLADTFYSIGLVMRLCQSLSALELLHILVGIEENHFFPRFLQIMERIVILFVVITSQEEVQGKYIVCALFFLWTILDVVRYTYSMLSITGIYYPPLTWLNYTLWIPLYPLSIVAKAFAICVSLPYFESFGTYSTKLPFPFTFSIYFPYVLKMYLVMLFIGTYFIIKYLYSERKAHLRESSIKKKRS
ncbi:very-long-chain (3R)-3-hydroxyacyl-CoA dehydratase 4 isoform A [Alligator mississippiensis]|uniref:Very-long-chain (3R)-3-hydroxyacyl-CoA dehydratase n=2 Tax=Alligator mississippiensis TaxID=8496 RepID=A0A151LZA6_ALLMI|nr:very-long-chain (3R)-3-hydroxyacyl-CoA dehydratase 4 isoform A [Alligator mississippiensis]